MGIKDVYAQIPVLENEEFLLRAIDEDTDTEELLRVYSDEKAVPFFNADNCHGDTFYYDTVEKMKKAMAFWKLSYENKYFVRWAVVHKTSGQVIGTIELFNRQAEDYFNNCGLLRLDVRSDYETAERIGGIFDVILPMVQELFHCDKIATKAIAAAKQRTTALKQRGFQLSGEMLIGHDGTAYDAYYVKAGHNAV